MAKMTYARAGHADSQPIRNPGKVSSSTCLSAMKTLGPVSEELIKLLNLPKDLYQSGDGFSRISFSSQPDITADDVARYLLLRPTNLDFPQAPDFGILLTSRGTNSFCVFVDRSRKVIIFQNVKNIHAETGSWNPFCARLKEALEEARRSETEGGSFEFIVRGERNFVV